MERRSILDLFKKEKPNQTKTYTTFKELGTYRSSFGSFGNDIYNSDDVRACVRALSEHTSKANPKCTDKKIEKLLSYNPNKYMNGKDMLAKLRNILEIKNTHLFPLSKQCQCINVPFQINMFLSAF